MTELTAKETISALDALVEYFGGIPDDQEGRVKFWDMLALKLSRIAQKSPPWSWRYPHSVYHGSLEPSKKFVSAILALGMAIDEVPSTMILYAVETRVYTRPGSVQDGSVVLGSSKPCKRPGCPVSIVPNVPWRDYCSDECYNLDKRRKR